MGKQQERIAKHLARRGVGSRRQVERWIAEGRVRVAGRRLQTPAVKVEEGCDITLDGAAVAQRKPPVRLWRYHKPRGLLTSHADPQGRPTVFACLPAGLPRVISVGRLDLDSEGLLLLTNDGALARQLELPASGWERRYRVLARGRPDAAGLDALNRGVRIGGARHRCRIRMERRTRGGAWLAVALHEGKNRQIRRMLEHIGLEVERLIRLSHGPFRLARLQPGEVREVPRAALRRLQPGTGHAHQRR